MYQSLSERWRAFGLCAALLLLGAPAPLFAHDLRIDADASSAKVLASGDTGVRLALSARVPYRIFTLTGPDRLIVDLKGIVGGRVASEHFATGPVGGVRMGLFSPQWTRLVMDLATPMNLTSAAYEEGGDLAFVLSPATRSDFDAASRAPIARESEMLGGANSRAPDPSPHDTGKFRIAIDAGHGGVDPGAVRGEVAEKDVVLKFATEFAALAERDGRFEIVLVREEDRFISLRDRVERARRAGAHLFISVHANTVERGHASGATVHTLSERASDKVTADFAARENGADADAGLDIRAELDMVHGVLSELASVETNVRSRDFADTLVDHLRPAIGVLAKKPHRSARFSVLKAADMPSVLLELGFLSSDEDRANMLDPAWREEAGRALLEAIAAWGRADEAQQAKMFR